MLSDLHPLLEDVSSDPYPLRDHFYARLGLIQLAPQFSKDYYWNSFARLLHALRQPAICDIIPIVSKEMRVFFPQLVQKNLDATFPPPAPEQKQIQIQMTQTKRTMMQIIQRIKESFCQEFHKECPPKNAVIVVLVTVTIVLVFKKKYPVRAAQLHTAKIEKKTCHRIEKKKLKTQKTKYFYL